MPKCKKKKKTVLILELFFKWAFVCIYQVVLVLGWHKKKKRVFKCARRLLAHTSEDVSEHLPHGTAFDDASPSPSHPVADAVRVGLTGGLHTRGRTSKHRTGTTARPKHQRRPDDL